jgi:hypothetical protein
MAPIPPTGGNNLSTGSVTFLTDAFSGGESVSAGTTTVYVNMRTDADRTLTLTLSYGSGSTWTTLGTTSTVVNTGGVVQLVTVSFSTSAHTFVAGEQLRLQVTGNFGANPNGVYWDGTYNDSRVVLPGPSSPTATPTATATTSPTSTPTSTPTATATSVAGPLAVDTVTSGTGTTSPITVSHTTSGTNRLMLVGISGATTGPDLGVSGVTYGGTALSLVGTRAYAVYQKIWIYGLVAPATGTADVVVTFSRAPDGGAIVGVVTFTGVNQSVPVGAFAGATGNSITPSLDVSSASGELVFDTVNHFWGPLTAGAGQTQRWSAQSADINGGGSTEPGASTVTMSWTAYGSNTWVIGAVSIKP